MLPRENRAGSACPKWKYDLRNMCSGPCPVTAGYAGEYLSWPKFMGSFGDCFSVRIKNQSYTLWKLPESIVLLPIPWVVYTTFFGGMLKHFVAIIALIPSERALKTWHSGIQWFISSIVLAEFMIIFFSCLSGWLFSHSLNTEVMLRSICFLHLSHQCRYCMGQILLILMSEQP